MSKQGFSRKTLLENQLPELPFAVFLSSIVSYGLLFSVFWCKNGSTILKSRYWAKLKPEYFQFPNFWSIYYKRKVTEDQWLNLTREAKKVKASCDVIPMFPIYVQFGAIGKPDSGPTVCKTYIFSLIATLYLTRTGNRAIKPLIQLSHHYFE